MYGEGCRGYEPAIEAGFGNDPIPVEEPWTPNLQIMECHAHD
jgi:hypothetical protein